MSVKINTKEIPAFTALNNAFNNIKKKTIYDQQ